MDKILKNLRPPGRMIDIWVCPRRPFIFSRMVVGQGWPYFKETVKDARIKARTI